MDFFEVVEREGKNGTEVYPDFIVGRSKDLMIRGGHFYAIWDEANQVWNTDEYVVQQMVDDIVSKAAAANPLGAKAKLMKSNSTRLWAQFKQHLATLEDNAHQLDAKLTFANTPTKRSDYASKRLPYPLEEGDTSAWDELIGTLYSSEERAKIEWAIGAVVSGDSKRIQKFLVLYGPAGTGKSTVLNIIQKLFSGYETSFEAKALGSNNGQFATEAFKNNPLVAIQHDGDLSRIEDNTRLNSIVSHEDMTMNEKYKPSYTSRVNAFLFMGTNQPVKISDSKSGIIRRLIDVHPTGVKLAPKKYQELMGKIDFELGAIAQHCLSVYRKMGKNYYNAYRPVLMMFQTDVFFNFIEAYFDVFKSEDKITVKRAYSLYKEFCSETGIEKPMPMYKFRSELMSYFDDFAERGEINGEIERSVFSGFNANKFKQPVDLKTESYSLVMDEKTALLDILLADCPAQYGTTDEVPKTRWANVKTTLKDLDSSQLHFVKVPDRHIVIDFDLTNDKGEKSRERNLEAASVWPPTYAEFSKSGAGVHLHYNWTGGDPALLKSQYSDGIEVKVFTGGSSLRRRYSTSNSVPVADLNGGLPLKEKKMLAEKTLKTEKALRELIDKNLRKEIHPGTKSSVDFIVKILEEAYESGMVYDVSDYKSQIVAFANGSTHQPMLALRAVMGIKWKSELVEEIDSTEPPIAKEDAPVAFFDVEVYPNLFVVCWKYAGSDTVTKMINPKPTDMKGLMELKLIGFNCRRYDNHIIYARHLGYDNEALYKLSQRIINNDRGALFGNAYDLSYTDIYDYSSKKQSLKKFEIELGVKHMELDIPWDQPVKDEDIPRVVEYCANDVRATEVTHEARKQDFVARQILADLSGLTVNHSTQQHTARIVFKGDKNPQAEFVYTKLEKMFPGYKYEMGKSTYKGEIASEGGYVYAEPGMWENVAVLDIASMHPTSIELLNMFGPYTKNFSDLKNARVAIKRNEYAKARKMLDGKLEPYLKDEADAKALSYALKIVINIVYGLTSAKFDNAFLDKRNKDNIVAKRGALFMIDLKEFVKAEGFDVAHIKTDSIKIPNATDEIIKKVFDFGAKYGYEFEHEATYSKFCLVNDAVYIAKIGWAADERLIGTWSAVGAQFAHPYVYKTLFTKEELTFDDFCETKQVSKGVMYLDFEEDTPAVLPHEGMHHVGRTGRFIPVIENGAKLLRVFEDKQYAVSGTKGFQWLEAEDYLSMDNKPEIDMTYFENLADKAQAQIEHYTGFGEFVA